MNRYGYFFKMVPVRGIEPRVDPYHGPVLPLYYTGICFILTDRFGLCQGNSL